jgi:hypothetical protein
MSRRCTALLLALVCSACSGADETEPPPQEAPQYGELDARIFVPACTFACHSGGEFAGGGLDMTVPPSKALIDVPAVAAACADGGWKRVVPGRPEQSLLYLKIAAKLEGTEPPCGDGMPAGANRPSLSADEVAEVRAWIEAGALEE